jgi:xylulokinase
MTRNLLAIDVGTQSTRAAVVGMSGVVRGAHAVPHEIDSPQPGWAQQRPEAWWDEACAAIRAVLQETGTPPKSIAAVGGCGQMHGPVGINGDGQVTTPAVQLWCDKRCHPQCEAVRARNGGGELDAITANPINPAWTALKVSWHREHEPDVYERTRVFLVPKDFINFRLTGVAATDPSEASGSFLWDARKDAYSAVLADAVGVDLARFAPAFPSHAVVGTVTEQASRATGLPAGTPVVAGGGDFPVSMLGCGVVGEGEAADVTGTSTLLAVHSREPLVHPAVQNLRHVVDGWIAFTILDCGGLSVKWSRDLLLGRTGGAYAELIQLAATVPAGSDGLVFYPYMLGERRLDNVSARGAYVGLGLAHGPAHLARAAMEGVALALGRDARLFARLGVALQRVRAVGGGTRNALWNRIKADVLQVPLEIADDPEAGLKGAALLAAAGAGLVSDVAAAARERRLAGSTVRPRAEDRQAYARASEEFDRVYEHMLGFWSR